MLKMEPACKDYLWGGECLREKYHIRADCHPLAEAWMLSCHPDGPSRIAQGPCKGMTLADYAAACGSGFWGKRCESFAQFPMLIKLIDAAKDLSVQVHPGDRYVVAMNTSRARRKCGMCWKPNRERRSITVSRVP